MTAPIETELTKPQAPLGEGAGERCPGCRGSLPIRAKLSGETAAHWECAACGSLMTGILLKEAAAEAAETIRVGQIHFDTKNIRPLSSYLRQLVREFVACRMKNPEVDERRTVQRVPMLLDLEIVPIDDNWSPCAKPVLGMMIDITPNGLGMVTSIQVEAEYVVVQIRHPSGLVQLLGKIAWRKDFGPDFHNAGVQFLLRLGRCMIIS